MATNPPDIGANIPPLVRDYIDGKFRALRALIDAALEDVQTKHEALMQREALFNSYVTVKLNEFAKTIETDPDYRVTRAKLARLCKELGLE